MGDASRYSPRRRGYRPIARALAALLALALCGAAPTPAPSSTPAPAEVQGDRIYQAARANWGGTHYPRYATYTVGISYERDKKLVQLHYETYEDLRRSLVYARAFSAEEEKNPKVPTGINFTAGSIDGSGGMVVNHDRADDPVGTLALGINQDYRIARHDTEIRALSDSSDVANASSLPVIGGTTTGSRDYTVRLVETTTEDGKPIAHLALTPRRDPHQYIVRDLWVDTSSSTILRARLAENFNGGPLHDVSWIVRYTRIEGAPYIASETAESDVTYHDDEVLKNITITFTNLQPLDILPWRYAVGLEPHPAVTDP